MVSRGQPRLRRASEDDRPLSQDGVIFSSSPLSPVGGVVPDGEARAEKGAETGRDDLHALAKTALVPSQKQSASRRNDQRCTSNLLKWAIRVNFAATESRPPRFRIWIPYSKQHLSELACQPRAQSRTAHVM